MVVSDHSPCTPELKKLDSGDFAQAWGGISSLQFGETRLSTFLFYPFIFCRLVARIKDLVNKLNLTTQIETTQNQQQIMMMFCLHTHSCMGVMKENAE